ncbi:MAG: alanine--glyoxylate aminotransferase family protein [Candidatus Omnitrophota bacterium]|nr:alanine--glyoxylate aminotransferase family protein [Candidatus Omnitrophota bacterium]MBU1929597.1 alanine--glyoxylate aminotransferase family protein [Candidatus Omnitrophota bacterium]MBU2034790.1 alanine--glyoxylate aminotransferase family protein [Candidatus Omnitrophota bacterium]MBU2221492.1 alanine--glyoxylate aminotransferase family protein [Candidatus Omnitrophota bacterium]MBU2257852.1 alanine--glyoxylate aminotransferase family protein [Candidatus Omnitrophota bacterium]
MKKNYLLTPGPTPLPAEVCEALARPIIHHRTPQFQAILKEAHEGLKYVYQTTSNVFILASSGTGAMETAVINFLSPGDTVITVEGGKFGERWTEICLAYGINCEVLKVEWGKAVDPKDIEKQLKSNPKIKAVFTTLCETSTGVVVDMQAIGAAVKDTSAILVVDAISGLGAIDLKTDAWNCDVVVSGSQKGLMLPPGLGFISVSPKAWKLSETSKCPKYYFSLKAAQKAYESTDTPWTPAIGLIIALNDAIKLMKQDGLENIFKRHNKMADATRAAMKALGLELFSPTAASDVVTAAKVPAGLDGEKLVKTMRDIHGVTIAGGQSEMKGKLIRIAHMGYIGEFDIILGISCLEKVLAQMGYKFQMGAGVKAAEEVFLK